MSSISKINVEKAGISALRLLPSFLIGDVNAPGIAFMHCTKSNLKTCDKFV